MKTSTLGRFSQIPWMPEKSQWRSKRIFSQNPKLLPTAQVQNDEQSLTPEAVLAMREWQYDPRTSGTTFRNHISTAAQFKVERAIRTKSELDDAFFFTSQQCISEAYKLCELSSNRRVLVLDVNSMFPWILKTAKFPDPSKLKLERSATLKQRIEDGEIDNGMFLCRVKYKTQHANSLNEFAPIFCGIKGASVAVAQSKEEQFALWLHCCEIKSLLPYADIDVSMGIFSSESIAHPLRTWVDKGYAQKQRSTGSARDVAKDALTTLHCCTLTRKTTQTEWLTQEDVEEVFSEKFLSEPFEKQNYAQTIDQDDKGRCKLRIYDQRNPKNIYSLSSCVFAQARAKMFDLIMHTRKMSNVRICYSNIDSLHLSVDSDAVQTTLEHIGKYQPVGQGLGELKLECNAKHGVWFDAGVYWLFDEDMKVMKFATIDSDAAAPLKTRAKYNYECPITGIQKQASMPLFKSLSQSKMLDKAHNWIRPTLKQATQSESAMANTRTGQIKEIVRIFKKIRSENKANFVA